MPPIAHTHRVTHRGPCATLYLITLPLDLRYNDNFQQWPSKVPEFRRPTGANAPGGPHVSQLTYKARSAHAWVSQVTGVCFVRVVCG